MSDLQSPAQQTAIEWEGRSIQLSYRAQYFEGFAHLEIRSDDKQPLPMTATGYRSHFFAPDHPLSLEDVKALVFDWLEEKAKSRKWRAYLKATEQPDLFG